MSYLSLTINHPLAKLIAKSTIDTNDFCYFCRMEKEILDTKRKALKINLDPRIYGTFAEIGAGQEVSRNFFNAGAASGTVAKTMSA